MVGIPLKLRIYFVLEFYTVQNWKNQVNKQIQLTVQASKSKLN